MALGSAAGQEQFAANGRTDQVEIIEAQSLDESDALQQRRIEVDLITWRTEHESLRLGGLKRKALALGQQRINDNVRDEPGDFLVERLKVAIGKMLAENSRANARCAARQPVAIRRAVES